jgi:hypothetical protein
MPFTKDGGWVPAPGEIFRALTPDEVIEFQEYAEDHDPPEDDKLSFCHPVCRGVWGK